MRRWWCLLLIVGAACVPLSRPKEDLRPVATLERLRSDPKGVCASVVNVQGDAWIADKNREPKTRVGDKLLANTVQACARAKPAADGGEDGAKLDVALIFPQEDDRWQPKFWHLEVIRQNGLVVFAGNLASSRIEDGVCVLDVCNKEGYATAVLSEPWQVDEYRIRLTHVPTRRRVELFITLN